MHGLKCKFSKTLVLLFVMLVVSGSSYTWAQTFSHPQYKAKNAKDINIQSVELKDNYTIFHIQVRTSASHSIFISSKTYIINSDEGEPLYIQKADGIELNELYTENADSRKLKLYFPRIGKDVQNIDYRSGKEGNFWHFFEINVASDIGVDKTIKSGTKGKEGKCRFINNPGYTAKSRGFKITKLELCDTATVLHFKVHIPNNGWIYIPSKSCIRDSKGGENLFVSSIEGTNMDERISSDQTINGTLYYRLFFPPLKKSVKTIDFREINNGGSWFVYELDAEVR